MESRYITLKSNLTIHTLTQGDPSHPALVLLHGWPSSSLLWRHMIPKLSQKFHVLAPDLPGHGKSDKPADAEYNLDFLRGFILDFFDALNLEKAHLCVHDIGGMAGLSFAVRYPERLDKFVVMNTSPYPDWPLLLSLSIFLLKQQSLSRFFLNRMIFRQILKTGFHDNGLITPDIIDTFRNPWMESKDAVRAFSKTVAVPPERMVETKAELRNINIPTLILWGKRDVYFPFRIARQLHQDIKTSTLAGIDHAGHFLQEEQPDQITRELIRFL